MMAISVYLLLGLLNLFFDAHIWRIVQSILRKINWIEALDHNLKSYGLSFITPLQGGELAARYLVQRKKSHREKSVFLTFWNHLPRLSAKVMISLMALPLLLKLPYAYNWLSHIIIIGLLLFAYLKAEKVLSYFGTLQFRGIALERFFERGRPNSSEKLKLLALNGLRFLIFSGQLATFIIVFEPTWLSGKLVAAIPVFYLFTAIIPTWSAFDFLVKGGLSLYFFEQLGYQSEIFALGASAVWLSNVAIPALIGLSRVDFTAFRNFQQRTI